MVIAPVPSENFVYADIEKGVLGPDQPELVSPDETTVVELYELLKVPPDEVKRIFVSGLSKAPSHALSDGDRVALFPPIGGG